MHIVLKATLGLLFLGLLQEILWHRRLLPMKYSLRDISLLVRELILLLHRPHTSYHLVPVLRAKDMLLFRHPEVEIGFLLFKLKLKL